VMGGMGGEIGGRAAPLYMGGEDKMPLELLLKASIPSLPSIPNYSLHILCEL